MAIIGEEVIVKFIADNASYLKDVQAAQQALANFASSANTLVKKLEDSTRRAAVAFVSLTNAIQAAEAHAKKFNASLSSGISAAEKIRLKELEVEKAIQATIQAKHKQKIAELEVQKAAEKTAQLKINLEAKTAAAIENANTQLKKQAAHHSNLYAYSESYGLAMFKHYTSLGAQLGYVVRQYVSLWAIINATKNIISTGMGFTRLQEESTVAFTIMMKNATEAKNKIEELYNFAVKSPLTFRETIESSKQLMAYGFQPNQLVETMKMLGNVAKAVGVDLNDLAYVYGTLMAQGRAYTRDLMQFAMRGIPIYEELAKVMGVPVQKIQEMTSEGKVGFKEVEAAFRNMTSEGGRFGGLMEAWMNTLSGKMSMLTDTFEKWSSKIAIFSTSYLRDLVTNITNFLGSTSGFNFGTDLAAAINIIIKSLNSLIQTLISLRGIIAWFLTVYVSIKSVIGIARFVGSLADRVFNLGVAFLNASEAMSGFIKNIGFATTILKDLFSLILSSSGGPVAVFLGLAAAAGLVATAMIRAKEKLEQYRSSILSEQKKDLESAKIIGDIYNEMMERTNSKSFGGATGITGTINNLVQQDKNSIAYLLEIDRLAGTIANKYNIEKNYVLDMMQMQKIITVEQRNQIADLYTLIELEEKRAQAQKSALDYKKPNAPMPQLITDFASIINEDANKFATAIVTAAKTWRQEPYEYISGWKLDTKKYVETFRKSFAAQEDVLRNIYKDIGMDISGPLKNLLQKEFDAIIQALQIAYANGLKDDQYIKQLLARAKVLATELEKVSEDQIKAYVDEYKYKTQLLLVGNNKIKQLQIEKNKQLEILEVEKQNKKITEKQYEEKKASLLNYYNLAVSLAQKQRDAEMVALKTKNAMEISNLVANDEQKAYNDYVLALVNAQAQYEKDKDEEVFLEAIAHAGKLYTTRIDLIRKERDFKLANLDLEMKYTREKYARMFNTDEVTEFEAQLNKQLEEIQQRINYATSLNPDADVSELENQKKAIKESGELELEMLKEKRRRTEALFALEYTQKIEALRYGNDRIAQMKLEQRQQQQSIQNLVTEGKLLKEFADERIKKMNEYYEQLEKHLKKQLEMEANIAKIEFTYQMKDLDSIIGMDELTKTTNKWQEEIDKLMEELNATPNEDEETIIRIVLLLSRAIQLRDKEISLIKQKMALEKQAFLDEYAYQEKLLSIGQDKIKQLELEQQQKLKEIDKMVEGGQIREEDKPEYANAVISLYNAKIRKETELLEIQKDRADIEHKLQLAQIKGLDEIKEIEMEFEIEYLKVYEQFKDDWEAFLDAFNKISTIRDAKKQAIEDTRAFRLQDIQYKYDYDIDIAKNKFMYSELDILQKTYEYDIKRLDAQIQYNQEHGKYTADLILEKQKLQELQPILLENKKTEIELRRDELRIELKYLDATKNRLQQIDNEYRKQKELLGIRLKLNQIDKEEYELQFNLLTKKYNAEIEEYEEQRINNINNLRIQHEIDVARLINQNDIRELERKKALNDAWMEYKQNGDWDLYLLRVKQINELATLQEKIDKRELKSKLREMAITSGYERQALYAQFYGETNVDRTTREYDKEIKLLEIRKKEIEAVKGSTELIDAEILALNNKKIAALEIAQLQDKMDAARLEIENRYGILLAEHADDQLQILDLEYTQKMEMYGLELDIYGLLSEEGKKIREKIEYESKLYNIKRRQYQLQLDAEKYQNMMIGRGAITNQQYSGWVTKLQGETFSAFNTANYSKFAENFAALSIQGTQAGDLFAGLANGASIASGALLQLVTSVMKAVLELENVQQLLNFIDTVVKEIFKVIGKDLNRVFAPFVAVLKLIGQYIGSNLLPIIKLLADVMEFLYNTVVTIINKVIDVINELISMVNKIPGINIALLNHVKTLEETMNAEKRLADMKQKFTDIISYLNQKLQSEVNKQIKTYQDLYENGLITATQYQEKVKEMSKYLEQSNIPDYYRNLEGIENIYKVLQELLELQKKIEEGEYTDFELEKIFNQLGILGDSQKNTNEMIDIANSILRDAVSIIKIYFPYIGTLLEGLLGKLNVPSHATGVVNVPKNTLARIHEGEMILPKTFADSVRSGEISIGKTSNSSGNIYVTVNVEGSVLAENDLATVIMKTIKKQAVRGYL